MEYANLYLARAVRSSVEMMITLLWHYGVHRQTNHYTVMLSLVFEMGVGELRGLSSLVTSLIY